MNWLVVYLSSTEPAAAAQQIARGIRDDDPLALLMLVRQNGISEIRKRFAMSISFSF